MSRKKTPFRIDTCPACEFLVVGQSLQFPLYTDSKHIHTLYLNVSAQVTKAIYNRVAGLHKTDDTFSHILIIHKDITHCMLDNFAFFVDVCESVLKIFFCKPLRNTIRVSNSLNNGQARFLSGLMWVQTGLQLRLSADDNSCQWQVKDVYTLCIAYDYNVTMLVTKCLSNGNIMKQCV